LIACCIQERVEAGVRFIAGLTHGSTLPVSQRLMARSSGEPPDEFSSSHTSTQGMDDCAAVLSQGSSSAPEK
jgi:hypothetical protein